MVRITGTYPYRRQLRRLLLRGRQDAHAVTTEVVVIVPSEPAVSTINRT